MRIDAEELIGRTAASLMSLQIVPDLIPQHDHQCFVALPFIAGGEQYRALFTADDDQPILRLIVFLKPNVIHRSFDEVLAAATRANAMLPTGAFFVTPSDGTIVFYTHTLLGTDDALPASQMIEDAKVAIEELLPVMRELH